MKRIIATVAALAALGFGLAACGEKNACATASGTSSTSLAIPCM